MISKQVRTNKMNIKFMVSWVKQRPYKNGELLMSKISHKYALLIMALVSSLFITMNIAAQEGSSSGTPVFEQYEQQMKLACPKIWEDLGVAISSDVPQDGDPWKGDLVDRNEFKQAYALNNVSATDESIEQIASTLSAVSAECASYRIALLDLLLTKAPQNAATALEEAVRPVDYLTEDSKGWEIGDVRLTGRSTAIEGWVFLYGQTVGSIESGAQLAGERYMDLYELAKGWAPNLASESWEAGQTVTLPDMRGRSIYGRDNMGGIAANVVSDTNADKIGGQFGSEEVTLTQDQMPTHTHAMNTVANHAHDSSAVGNHGHTMGNSPSHNHSMGYAGTHGHSLRTSTFQGSGGARSDWPYFEGRARPNYQNNIPSSVQSAGNHKHSIGNGGVHQHTVNAAGGHDHSISNAGGHGHTNAVTGGSGALNVTSPGIVFNVEMKY